jgi:hypothetical protein
MSGLRSCETLASWHWDRKTFMKVCKEQGTRQADASKGLWFSFEIGDEEYVAFVSTEALLTHFQAAGADKRDLSRSYRKHRELINTVAIERFLGRAPRPVKLGISDFYCPGLVSGSSLREAATAAP